MNDTRPTLRLEMPYIGTKGEQILRVLNKKRGWSLYAVDS